MNVERLTMISMNCGNLIVVAGSWLPLGIILPAVYEDIKTQVFDPRPCLAMAIVNLCFVIIVKQEPLTHQLAVMIWGMSPGFILALISFLSGFWIGEGDCLLLMLIGAFKGWRFVLVSAFYCFTAIFIAAIVLMIFKRLHRSATLPMAPFLVMGYILAEMI